MWDVHEQVAVAAMECGCKELALQLVKNVHKRFPEGARGSRLTVRCAAGHGLAPQTAAAAARAAAGAAGAHICSAPVPSSRC